MEEVRLQEEGDRKDKHSFIQIGGNKYAEDRKEKGANFFSSELGLRL